MKNLKKFLLVFCCVVLLAGCGNVKLKNGENAAVTFKGDDGISSDELYNELKKNEGAKALINMIDTYLLDKEYDVTKEEKDYVKDVISSVKEYAKQYNMEYETYISQYYGMNSEKAFEEYK